MRNPKKTLNMVKNAFLGEIVDEMHEFIDEMHVKKGRNNKKSKKMGSQKHYFH